MGCFAVIITTFAARFIIKGLENGINMHIFGDVSEDCSRNFVQNIYESWNYGKSDKKHRIYLANYHIAKKSLLV